jgi:hypothetical protein
MKGFFRKNTFGALVPDDPEAQYLMTKVKIDAVVECEVKRIRNIGMHRKFFSLLKYAFDQMEFDDQRILFDDFRSQVIMLAGHKREVVSFSTGETRWEPKSISFSSMSQDDFEQLYDDTIEVLLRYVLKKYDRADIERVMSGIVEYG